MNETLKSLLDKELSIIKPLENNSEDESEHWACYESCKRIMQEWESKQGTEYLNVDKWDECIQYITDYLNI